MFIAGKRVDIKDLVRLMGFEFKRRQDPSWCPDIEKGGVIVNGPSASRLTTSLEYPSIHVEFVVRPNLRFECTVDGVFAGNASEETRERVSFFVLGYFENGWGNRKHRFAAEYLANSRKGRFWVLEYKPAGPLSIQSRIKAGYFDHVHPYIDDETFPIPERDSDKRDYDLDTVCYKKDMGEKELLEDWEKRGLEAGDLIDLLDYRIENMNRRLNAEAIGSMGEYLGRYPCWPYIEWYTHENDRCLHPNKKDRCRLGNHIFFDGKLPDKIGKGPFLVRRKKSA